MALEQFHAWLQGRRQEELGPVTLEGPENYQLLQNSELKDAHVAISSLISVPGLDRARTNDTDGTTKAVLSGSRDQCSRYALALLERLVGYHIGLCDDPSHRFSGFYDYGEGLGLLAKLAKQGDMQNLRFPLLEWLSMHRNLHYSTPVLEAVLADFDTRPPDQSEHQHLVNIRCHLVDGNSHGLFRELLEVVDARLGQGPWSVLAPVEKWALEASEEIQALPAEQAKVWMRLLAHCRDAKSANPTTKWKTAAAKLTATIPDAEFRDRVAQWFRRVDAGRTTRMLSETWSPVDDAQRLHDLNGNVLRGLLWLCPPRMNSELLRAVRELAYSAYRKIRGLGPRAVKVGNAALAVIGAVGTVEAVGQLAILKVRVKFGTAQKLIEKALVNTAALAGVPREELEEMAVPAYGLSEVGKRIEVLGDYRAELVIEGKRVELRWYRPDGKPQKSLPAPVKQNYGEELKELKAAVKDVQGMLPAQSARIEDAYRLEKSWSMADWRERYLEHPLVGSLARRLIWSVGGTLAIAPEGALIDVQGKPVASSPETRVSLWHPLSTSPDDVAAWRDFIESHQIVQPFKQAHREIYRLTDAELRTGTYSNRFAAHIVKQHQFNSLVAARGWKHRLRLMVDDSYPPATIELPQWNLRAEFWVEGIGDQYGTDTTESGAFLYLSTDQVRFYRIDAAANTAHAGGGRYETHGEDAPVNHPLPLEGIPELVLSEVLRDVDLFVGVASVGNDPTWNDGGPGGRFREYWNNYSFGELSASASTRKEVLARLLPKLKVASRCELNDRWLIVRGGLRTYKIHLGSGNILMEPSNQYLCIVARQSATEPSSKVFLPFEGDNMMAVILSKAFMLADDKKITDSTILSQLRS